MILVSVHHVRFGDKEGINRFIYRHDGDVRDGAGCLDVLATEADPGELIAVEAEVEPGGNVVRAFLDVATVEPPDLVALRAELDVAKDQLSRHPPPIIRKGPAASIHFNAELGLEPTAMDEFTTLADRALAALTQPTPKGVRSQPPLVMMARYDDDGVQYEMEPESVDRVRAVRGEDWTPSSVTIAHHTLADFEALVGSFVGQLGPLLTKLSEAELLKFGGFQVRDAQTGNTLAEWPARK